MPLFRTPFDNTYRPAYRQVSRVVKGADLLFTCGQLDTDGAGQVQHPGDITAQTIRSMTLLFDALRQAGAHAKSLFNLQVFYRNTADFDTAHFMETLNSCLPTGCSPVVGLIPIQSFPKGVEIEVDAIAHANGIQHLRSVSTDNVTIASRCGDFFVAQVSCSDTSQGAFETVFSALQDALAEISVGINDVCKVRFLAPDLGPRPNATEQILGERLAAIRPVYTRLPLYRPDAEQRGFDIEVMGISSANGIPLPRFFGDTAIRCTSAWELPYPDSLQCASMIFVGGQLAPRDELIRPDQGNPIEQTRTVMRRIETLLSAYGATLDDTLKVNAYHQGQSDLQTWTNTVQARCDFYPSAGPASTGVEVPHVGMDGAALVVDCIASKD